MLFQTLHPTMCEVREWPASLQTLQAQSVIMAVKAPAVQMVIDGFGEQNLKVPPDLLVPKIVSVQAAVVHQNMVVLN